MIDINNINSFISGLGQKKGYKKDELPEIKAVYDFLIKNGLPTENFLAKLDTLILRKLGETEKQNLTAGGYKESTNTITYYEDIDLIHELFHMASTGKANSNSGITRINFNSKGNDTKINRGLDEGITDMFASMVNPKVPCGYPFEKMCADFLRNLFGIQVFNGYFENKYSNFVNAFPQEFQDNIREITRKLDNYHQLSIKSYYGQSTFAEIDALKNTVSDVINILYKIAQTLGISNDNLIEFFNDRISIEQYAEVRKLIGYDEALKNISNHTL